MTLRDIQKASLPICKEFNVKRLDVFGSIARGTSTDSSDVDLLIEFKNPDQSLARRFFGFLHHLEDVLGCHIDLLTSSGLRNPYFRAQVLRERVTIYEG